MKFIEEVKAFYGLYKKNISLIRKDSTELLFSYILKNPVNEVRPTNVSSVNIGSFYVILYNYNGNKLWCPILTIPPVVNTNEKGVLEKQLKINNDKKILYAVNFDYLPIDYKIKLIESIINNNIDRYEKNAKSISNDESVDGQHNFDVRWIYNFLKSKDKTYSITAYDITKIERVHHISSTILHRFIFLDTYYINNRLMYDTLLNINNEKLRLEFSNKIKVYEKIVKLYESDVELFYKSLRNFEKNLKLIDNL
jgi:hypothetical protein